MKFANYYGNFSNGPIVAWYKNHTNIHLWRCTVTLIQKRKPFQCSKDQKYFILIRKVFKIWHFLTPKKGRGPYSKEGVAPLGSTKKTSTIAHSLKMIFMSTKPPLVPKKTSSKLAHFSQNIVSLAQSRT